MEKTYRSQKVEKRIYAMWEKGGYFTPKIDLKKKPFVITIPLPNVTGGLHAGHAMFVIEDIMTRYHRMLGEPTLWLPGFDHASIAVEYLICKQLAKEGKTKQEVGRKEFLKRAHKFANDSKKYIREQLKLLGFSLDWTREAYTMDEIRSKAVKEAFKRLYRKGSIYQGEYLVNWCPKCQTAISNLENEYQAEKGQLYYMKYGPFVLATTRPETKFGDTAVAVHPDDKRYQKWIGKEFTYQSLIGPRKMKVVADKAVDPNFGTGVVKVTPGHDPTDFEISQRHKLKIIKVIDEKGKLTKVAGRFAGLTVAEARKKVVAELKRRGDLIKVEKITHSTGHCQRCGMTTEPMISKQWFVKIQPLAKRAIKAVKSGQIKIIPKRFEKIYFNWLENIRDWCISRQLWWGHKIPLKGEKDILDTWFSSALWPISVFDWPKKTRDLQYFYPTTIRETGYDILFFWVAREIMMCLAMTGKVPFKTIYLHGLVRDEKGRKFSKTKGIGFDPLEIIEKYGADALRMSLVVGNAPGNDLKIKEEKVIAYRNFANKVWNAARFILINRELKTQNSKRKTTPKTQNLKLNKDSQWILKELGKTVQLVTKHLNNYRFDLAAEKLYHFFWHTFCDEYIEMSKKRREEAQPVLLEVLRTSLVLLHPFMPFITEEIWQLARTKDKQQRTKFFKEEMLIISKWPKK